MQAQRQRGREVPAKRSPLPIFYTIIALIALVGGGALLWSIAARPAAPTGEGNTSGVHPLSAPVGTTPEGFYYKGSPDAPVKVIEYADFQCPACANVFQAIEGTIDQRYVETGKIQLIFHDFPLQQHDNAIPTAAASRCAGEQGKFWPMHNLLFARQRTWSDDRDITPRLLGYASDLGLDQAAFSTCLVSEKYVPALRDSAAAAIGSGIDSTPTYLVDGTKVTAPELEAAIEAALQAKGN
ncbi:MAG TPA: thioredoxin domain-containing protein [Herpetosiphonaceae bacterium]